MRPGQRGASCRTVTVCVGLAGLISFWLARQNEGKLILLKSLGTGCLGMLKEFLFNS